MASRSEEARLSRLMRPTFAAKVRATVAVREREKREKRLRDRKKRRSNSHQDRHGTAAEKQHEHEQGAHDSGLGNTFKAVPTPGSSTSTSSSRSGSRRSRKGFKRHHSQATPERRASLRQLIREEARAVYPASSEPRHRHKPHHGESVRSPTGSTSSDTGIQHTDSDAHNESKDGRGTPEDGQQKFEQTAAATITAATQPGGTATGDGHETLAQPPPASSDGGGTADDSGGGGGKDGDADRPAIGDEPPEATDSKPTPSKKRAHTEGAEARGARRTGLQRRGRGTKPASRAAVSATGTVTRHGKRKQGKAKQQQQQQQQQQQEESTRSSRSRSGMRWERPWRVNAARKPRSTSAGGHAGTSKRSGVSANGKSKKGEHPSTSASAAQGTSSSQPSTKQEGGGSGRGEQHVLGEEGQQQAPLQVLDATLTSVQELNELQTKEQVIELPSPATTTPQTYLGAVEAELASFARCSHLEAMVVGSVTEEHVRDLLSTKTGTLRLRAVVTAAVLCALEMVHEDTEHLPPWDSLRRIIKRRNLYGHIVSFDVRRWLGKHRHTLHLLDPLIQLSIEESQDQMGDAERLLRNWVHMQRRSMTAAMRTHLLEDLGATVAPITAGHLREIKALKRTQESLQRVVATAMLLAGHATSEDLTSWTTVKNLLNSDFVKSVMSTMPHAISADAAARARAHMQPVASTPCSQVRKKSIAVGQLLEWVVTSISAHLITKAAETRAETDL